VKSELDATSRQKLQEFREEVSKGRLVKFWNSASELPGLVALSLSRTIKTYPAVGWVRANQMPTTELLSEINDLRKRNAELESEVRALRGKQLINIENLASFDDAFKVYGTYRYNRGNNSSDWTVITTWREMFGFIAPYLIRHPSDDTVKFVLKKGLIGIFSNDKDGNIQKYGQTIYDSDIDDQIYQTVKIQFIALGLVDVTYSKTVQGGMALFWTLTRRGLATMMEVRTVRSDTPKPLRETLDIPEPPDMPDQ
jgi:hypothetical protein